MLRNDGEQVISNIVSGSCQFPGISESIDVSYLGGNKVSITLVLDGQRGGRALSRLASKDGIPIELDLEFRVQDEIVRAKQVFSVTLSRRVSEGVRIADGKVQNQSDDVVHLSWLPAEGNRFVPAANNRTVSIPPNGHVALDVFPGASEEERLVPHEAYYFLVSDPIDRLRRQGPPPLEQIAIANRIPAILSIAGTDLPVDWVEVVVASENGERYGSYSLSPRNAINDQVAVWRTTGERLVVTGKVVLRDGTLDLKTQTLDGQSLYIDSSMIVE